MVRRCSITGNLIIITTISITVTCRRPVWTRRPRTARTTSWGTMRTQPTVIRSVGTTAIRKIMMGLRTSTPPARPSTGGPSVPPSRPNSGRPRTCASVAACRASTKPSRASGPTSRRCRTRSASARWTP
uniref:(northern house mosquito) hypothetical protein n=1 Tax=Culex pipiens TaxID=7175 RepID=A0A8D8G3J4_CULPI